MQYSPAGKVPILIDGDQTIWDSLAILEYLAERFPEKQLWPADARARSHARVDFGRDAWRFPALAPARDHEFVAAAEAAADAR